MIDQLEKKLYASFTWYSKLSIIGLESIFLQASSVLVFASAIFSASMELLSTK